MERISFKAGTSGMPKPFRLAQKPYAWQLLARLSTTLELAFFQLTEEILDHAELERQTRSSSSPDSETAMLRPQCWCQYSKNEKRDSIGTTARVERSHMNGATSPHNMSESSGRIKGKAVVLTSRMCVVDQVESRTDLSIPFATFKSCLANREVVAN